MSTTDLPGSSLLAGRYRLVERLGAGGMSVVWRGFDEVLGRQVAVKVLPPSTSADPSFRRRLRAEAQAAARLSHPHITNVYDYGEATTVDGEPVPYVVMELVDGESLAAVLARVRRLPWPAAVRICAEVSAALAAAHARGIVHRDVTPANVMLTSTGAKVVDFGISALIGENDIDPDGSLLGTPAYLAPERLEGGQVSPATDVYAVGLLIYRTLIGQLPWDVGTTTALLRAHQYTEPEPLPPVEGLPHAVEALVGRCLEKGPDDRPSSAELAHVLAGLSAGAPAPRSFVPDWADNSEDTTILPSRWQTDGFLGRVRPGHARVADAPAQAGRGVAAVPSGMGAAGLAAVADVDALGAPPPGARRSDAGPDAADPFADGAGYDGAGYPAPTSLADPLDPAAPVPANGGPSHPAQGLARNNRFSAAARSGTALPAEPGARRGTEQDAETNGWADRAGEAWSGPGGVGTADRAGDAPTAIRPPVGMNSRDPLAPQRQLVPPQRRGDDPPAPDGPGGGGRGVPTRRVLIVTGALVAFGAGAWAVAGTVPGRNAANVTPQPSVLAANGKCVVSYTVWSDDGKRFKAAVTVANRDTVPIKDWDLWFVMPGDQTMSGNGKLKLDQQDRGVTLTSADALSPLRTTTMQITGRYSESNAAPMVFQLDGKTCETFVSGKPGEPSRPVEHLAGGGVRLGPVPTTSNPVPGISIAPNGLAVPVPVVSTPGAATTPTAGATTPPAGTTGPATPSSAASTTTPPPPKPPGDDTPTTDPTTESPTTAPTTNSPPPSPSLPPPDPADQDPADQ
ncbi:protein kinase domain-containing protein [Krasilnikovia sp. M28-CT-15]|uniref:protein kinase domain-containing protein n=1 Tax=Krasilnikovia sp. M28-CT-15 TaxID=3373540 RepID=UPI00399C4FEB